MTKIYYWVFNAPTIMAATEQGIFTAPDNPNWIFPDDNDVPNSTVTDISDVPPNFQGILVGSFGVSDSSLRQTSVQLGADYCYSRASRLPTASSRCRFRVEFPGIVTAEHEIRSLQEGTSLHCSQILRDF